MLVLLAATAARASCTIPQPIVAPAEGSRGVPTDAEPVWISASPLGDLVLTADGEPLAATVTWTETEGSADMARVVVDGGLPPDSAITISDASFTLSFTTGTGPATGASPLVPDPVLIDSYAHPGQVQGDQCGETVSHSEARGARVWLATPTWSEDGGFLEARVIGDDGSEHHVIGGPETIELGQGACGLGNLDAIMGWSSLTVSVRGHAWGKGATTHWSDPVEIDLPWPAVDDPCDGGCTTAPRSSPRWLLLLPLAALERRQR